MGNWTYDENSMSGTLIVDEDVTISNVAALKERLVKAFKQADKVTIDVSASASVDVAGLQLLCACHRFSSSKGKTLCLQLNDNERFLDFLEDVGFAKDFFCTHGDTKECLWSSLN
jgi:ABC-type transporter Mla MlaB component